MKIVFKNYSTLNEQEYFEILNIRNKDFIRKNMITTDFFPLAYHTK